MRQNFQCNKPNVDVRKEWDSIAVFHDAGIQVDSILSYLWLVSAKLGVFPHLESRITPSTSPDNGPLKIITG